jgi:REP element-mobilizing transposase RayT
MEPIYTRHNCRIAYQLIWGLSVFWKQAPPSDAWLDALMDQTEQDNIRILRHRFIAPSHSQFLLSTQPHVEPLQIPARVKGRLQHLIRNETPKAFRRNYSLRSIGSTKRAKLEQHLATQLEHHPMDDRRVQTRLESFQIHQPEVDLSRPRYTGHAKYWYNLHVVMVNEARWMEIDNELLAKLQKMILKASSAKGHLLSRAAIVPDHLHVTLGCGLNELPLDVALSYMNNLVYACGMRAVFQYSCYVGTFGEYDLGAIADDEYVVQKRGSTGTMGPLVARKPRAPAANALQCTHV